MQMNYDFRLTRFLWYSEKGDKVYISFRKKSQVRIRLYQDIVSQRPSALHLTAAMLKSKPVQQTNELFSYL